MLAISRALLLNPTLLIMDEPTEGLAPVIVAQVEDMLVRLADEGDIEVLIIEQNIGVATEIAEQTAIMVNGRISRMMDSARSQPIATCSSASWVSAATPTTRHPPRGGRASYKKASKRARTARTPRPAKNLHLQPVIPTRWTPAGPRRPHRSRRPDRLCQRKSELDGGPSTATASAVARPRPRGGGFGGGDAGYQGG